jgi:hypothetical protein
VAELLTETSVKEEGRRRSKRSYPWRSSAPLVDAGLAALRHHAVDLPLLASSADAPPPCGSGELQGRPEDGYHATTGNLPSPVASRSLNRPLEKLASRSRGSRRRPAAVALAPACRNALARQRRRSCTSLCKHGRGAYSYMRPSARHVSVCTGRQGDAKRSTLSGVAPSSSTVRRADDEAIVNQVNSYIRLSLW